MDDKKTKRVNYKLALINVPKWYKQEHSLWFALTSVQTVCLLLLIWLVDIQSWFIGLIITIAFLSIGAYMLMLYTAFDIRGQITLHLYKDAKKHNKEP